MALGADGQVSLGNTIIKANARKVRKLGDGRVLAGFAGSTADAFTLFERFEGKLAEYGGQIPPQPQWSSRRTGEPTATCGGSKRCCSSPIGSRRRWCFSGNGDVIEPDEGLTAIGSGGPMALAAARALSRANTEARTARAIVAEVASRSRRDICIYTNTNDHAWRS